MGDAGVLVASTWKSITALSALQAGSDILILRHPKTLEHIRKYLSDIMVETTLDAMGVDMSLAGEAPLPNPRQPLQQPNLPLPNPPSKRSAPAAKPAPAPKVEKAPPMKRNAAASGRQAGSRRRGSDMGLTKDDR